ncbi:cytochrome c oxidase assembly protein [Janibacter limosus]|uniref:cytochrome c oxidase assembly protein n=1 Tax=Janibacter limosus TaxID=53458 RepID=UPI001F5EEE4F|nr:cytochrome c oxidase assembly protein [Janibacter limosus]
MLLASIDESVITGPAWVPTAPPSLDTLLSPTLQPVPLIPAIALLMGMLYVAGAVRLWTSGRRWPVWRCLSFLLGCGAIMVIMGAGIEGYGLRMFSVFMFQQLTLMLGIPAFLALGSPGTLLLRATPHRGPGRLVLRLAFFGLRSRLGRFLIHPAFTVPLFLFNFYGIYFSDIGDLLLPNWYGHVSLELLFLVSGLLFTVPLISADPLPVKKSHGWRVIDAFSEMPLHAFFGVIVMMSPAPMVDLFATAPDSWNIDPIRDQYLAGGLAWAYGELPSLLILLFIMAGWQRAEARQSALTDAEQATPQLDAYNAYLERLRQHEEKYQRP